LTGGIVVLGQQVVDGLYLLMDDGEILIILVYVDDPLLVASSLAAIYKMKDALHKRFEMKDLSEAKVILGLHIRRDKALGILKLAAVPPPLAAQLP